MENEEMLSWLRIISEHLDTIGNELKHIRNLLEPKAPFSLPQNDSNCDASEGQSEVIPLDLETFVTQVNLRKDDELNTNQGNTAS